MKNLILLIFLTLTFTAYSQVYEEYPSEYEIAEPYPVETEESAYIETIEYPEEYFPDEREYDTGNEYYVEP